MGERKIHGKWHFLCDKCVDMVSTGQEDFDSAKLHAKRSSKYVWLKHKPGETFTVFCPECYSKYMGKAYVRNETEV